MRHVRVKDDYGRELEEEEYYDGTVTDFDYEVDLTGFVFPFSYVQPRVGGGHATVQEAVEAFLGDSSPLKELVMEKVIDGFDFIALEAMIVG